MDRTRRMVGAVLAWRSSNSQRSTSLRLTIDSTFGQCSAEYRFVNRGSGYACAHEPLTYRYWAEFQTIIDKLIVGQVIHELRNHWLDDLDQCLADYRPLIVILPICRRLRINLFLASESVPERKCKSMRNNTFFNSGKQNEFRIPCLVVSKCWNN